MKSPISLLLFFLSIFYNFSVKAQVDTRVWQLIRVVDEIESYKNIKNTHIRATKSEMKGLAKTKFGELGNEKFIRDLENSKRKTLAYIGLQEWKMTDIKIEKTENEILLKMHGSYIDNDGILIGFVEVHKYIDKKSIQWLYIEPVSNVEKINFKLAENFTKVKYQP